MVPPNYLEAFLAAVHGSMDSRTRRVEESFYYWRLPSKAKIRAELLNPHWYFLLEWSVHMLALIRSCKASRAVCQWSATVRQ